MKPYSYSHDESTTLETLYKKGLTAPEMWGDESVKVIKSRIKKHYLKEQDQTCVYCKTTLHTDNGMVWDTEHIIDKDSAKQWTFEPLNLCVSCKGCNQSKGTRPVTKSPSYTSFPKNSNNYLLVHAHLDKYEDHIEVGVPGVTYRFKSDKGRKTIEICGLLRYHEVSGRKKVDPLLQAVLNYAGDNQTKESMQAAYDYLSSQLEGK